MKKSSFNGINNNASFIQTDFEQQIVNRETVVIDETPDDSVVRVVHLEENTDLGPVGAFSLRSMMQNGVNPQSLNINVSPNSRIETSDQLNQFAQFAEKNFPTPDSTAPNN